MIQQSLVLLKPDAVKRGIAGEILHRFERAGLKIVGIKLIQADKALGMAHYKKGDDWKKMVGERSVEDCKAFGIDIKTCFGTEDLIEIGDVVITRNAELISSGPVVAVVFEGPNAVKKIRGLVGPTFPETAPAGTIRGDFGLESAFSGMIRNRPTYNMIHASGAPEEAVEEINLWFKPDELLSYRRVHEDLYSY